MVGDVGLFFVLVGYGGFVMFLRCCGLGVDCFVLGLLDGIVRLWLLSDEKMVC